MRPRRVLILDDQPVTRHVLKTFLDRDERFHVVADAGTGREAVVFASTHECDSILLDQSMPQATGIQVLPLLRGLQPQARIVMFTHDCTMEMQARELGADMLITKDFTLAAVATALL